MKKKKILAMFLAIAMWWLFRASVGRRKRERGNRSTRGGEAQQS